MAISIGGLGRLDRGTNAILGQGGAPRQVQQIDSRHLGHVGTGHFEPAAVFAIERSTGRDVDAAPREEFVGQIERGETLPSAVTLARLRRELDLDLNRALEKPDEQ